MGGDLRDVLICILCSFPRKLCDNTLKATEYWLAHMGEWPSGGLGAHKFHGGV